MLFPSEVSLTRRSPENQAIAANLKITLKKPGNMNFA